MPGLIPRLMLMFTQGPLIAFFGLSALGLGFLILKLKSDIVAVTDAPVNELETEL
jgi:hypothetical protein